MLYQYEQETYIVMPSKPQRPMTLFHAKFNYERIVQQCNDSEIKVVKSCEHDVVALWTKKGMFIYQMHS